MNQSSKSRIARAACTHTLERGPPNAAADLSTPEPISAAPERLHETPAFAEVYREFATVVWRNLRRLGVPEPLIEDAVQDVFLVIHRRLSEFEGRSSMRTWIFGIVLRVASRHRQRARDDAERASPVPSALLEALQAPSGHGPHELLVQRQASELLQQVLAELEEDKRAMLVMVDLEQTTVIEAAEALEININTAYSRLRAARRAFEELLERRLKANSEAP